jgi:hypothetical protein
MAFRTRGSVDGMICFDTLNKYISDINETPVARYLGANADFISAGTDSLKRVFCFLIFDSTISKSVLKVRSWHTRKVLNQKVFVEFQIPHYSGISSF